MCIIIIPPPENIIIDDVTLLIFPNDSIIIPLSVVTFSDVVVWPSDDNQYYEASERIIYCVLFNR